MGQKLKKSEKLDLILSELAKLRGEVKKLVRVRAAVVAQRVKTKPHSALRRAKKPEKQTGTEKKPGRDVVSIKAGIGSNPEGAPADQPDRISVVLRPPQIATHDSTAAQSSRKPI